MANLRGMFGRFLKVRRCFPTSHFYESKLPSGKPKLLKLLSSTLSITKLSSPLEQPECEIKQAIVGTGSASKEQVSHMVVHLLRLDGVPAEDAADALAAALCHSHQRKTQNSMASGLTVASLR